MSRFLFLVTLLLYGLDGLARGQTLDEQVRRLGRTPESNLNELQAVKVPRPIASELPDNR